MEEIIDMKHVICIDLDGTLLNSNDEIGQLDLEYLKSIKNNHNIVLSSGRCYESIKKYYNQLELDTPLITDNGASLFNPNDPTFNPAYLFISEKDIVDIFKKLKKIIVSCMTNKNNVAYIYNHLPRTDFLLYFNNETRIIDGPFNKTIKEDLFNAFFIIESKSKEKFIELMKEYTNLKYRVLGEDANNYIVEITNAKTEKSYAVKKLLRSYKVSPELLIAFGDSNNDKETLLIAQNGYGHGVLMENSSNDLKEIITEKTTTNNDNGVSTYLKKFFKKATKK